MHALLLILTILFRAAVQVVSAPLLALTEVLEVIRDKALYPLDESLAAKRAMFREEVYGR